MRDSPPDLGVTPAARLAGKKLRSGREPPVPHPCYLSTTTKKKELTLPECVCGGGGYARAREDIAQPRQRSVGSYWPPRVRLLLYALFRDPPKALLWKEKGNRELVRYAPLLLLFEIYVHTHTTYFENSVEN